MAGVHVQGTICKTACGSGRWVPGNLFIPSVGHLLRCQQQQIWVWFHPGGWWDPLIVTVVSLGREWDRSRLEVLVQPELGEQTLDVLRGRGLGPLPGLPGLCLGELMGPGFPP